MRFFHLNRAQEWTAALSRWCDAHPDMVLYRGDRLVYQAEIMLLHGAWSDVMEETRRARERLAQPPEPARDWCGAPTGLSSTD